MRPGEVDRSSAKLAFSMTFGPATTDVTFPAVTRLHHATMLWVIGTPSKTAAIIGHSPSSSVAAPEPVMAGAAADTVAAVADRVRRTGVRRSVSSAKEDPGLVSKVVGRFVPSVAR